MVTPINSFSIWPVAPDVLEFLGPLDEAPLTAGLVVRAGRGVRNVVDRANRHFTRALFLVFALWTIFLLRGVCGRYGEPELDQASDRFGARRRIGLDACPFVDCSADLGGQADG